MSRGALLLLLLCLSTFVFGLGRTAITDSDEAYYAQAGREMLDGGDWTTPHFNFEPRLNKPILYYWLVAGTYRVAGVSEFAARLWAALSGVGLAFVAYAIGRRWIDGATGWLAGAIIASSTGLVILVRESLPDLPLALFVSVTIWAAIEATSGAVHPRSSIPPPANAGRRRRWLMIGAAAAALGMLTKGPVALAIAFTALAPLLIWERRPSARSTAPPLRLADMALALVLFIALAAPWYTAATLANGTGFLRQFFVGENIERFTTSTFNEWRGPGFYPAVLAGGLLPWSAFGLLWLPPLAGVFTRRRTLSPVTAHLVAWVLGPMCLLALSIGSQPRYILPCVVPVALLLAKAVTQRVRAQRGRDVLLSIATLLGGGSLVAIGVVLWRSGPLLQTIEAGWTPVGAALVVAAGAVIGAAAFIAPRSSLPAVLAVAATVATVSFLSTVQRPRRPEPVEQIAAAVRAEPPSPLCSCGAFARSLTYYTQRPVHIGGDERDLRDFLLRDDRVLAVADGDRLDAVERSLSHRFPRLAETTYLNLFDSDRRLQRVILVSNR